MGTKMGTNTIDTKIEGSPEWWPIEMAVRLYGGGQKYF